MAQAYHYTNRLIHEESPYLQQHAHNPIDWYPWGEEAFSKALKEDKPIFLSIGYSTCHWCHVMEHESFEDEKIADYMNHHYVNIKVDREELPHIDRYFQDVYMLLNKRAGGWPLTIIMTPDRKPFYAATYLPPYNRYGRPGLLGMAQYLWETFRDKRENVYKSADSIVAAMEQLSKKGEKIEVENREAKRVVSDFMTGIASVWDKRHKGIGDAPKFPQATTIGTLLHIYRLTGNGEALGYATEALEAMAKGGINDQIEGGFYRYSVDAMWMIPHFEKMLYTNAELVEVYSDAWLLTKNPLFRETIRRTVENIDARFRKEGLYFSASDADSDGEEGKYFLFDYDETALALRKEGFAQKEAEAVLAYWHITPEGNFEGKSNPYLTDTTPPPKLEKARSVLKALRAKRHYPFIDYKIQTSWNALWIKGLFKAAAVDPSYGEKAVATLDRLLERLWIEGELYHQIVLPNAPKVKGYLEDYAFLSDALLSAYSVTQKHRYLDLAKKLMQLAMKKFYHNGTWFMSDDTFRSQAGLYDASYRSALGVMLGSMLQLATLSEDQKRYAEVMEMIGRIVPKIYDAPHNFPTLTDLFLQSRYGWTVVKTTKEKIERLSHQLAEVRYPYVVPKGDSVDGVLACKIDRCFAHGEKIEDIIKKIE